MRANEFIQSLFGMGQSSPGTGVTINIGTVNINAQDAQTDDVEPTETDVMVPPLQQKIELLKKNAGLDNVYDRQADEDEPLE